VPYINQAGGGSAVIGGVTVTGPAVSGDVPVSTSSSAATWAFPPGHEYDYVEHTTNLTIAGTTEGTASTWIDGNAITFDGSTRVLVEAWCGDVTNNTTGTVVCVLFDGASSLGWLCEILFTSVAGTAVSFYGARFLTPSAAAHTYHVKWFKTGGTALVNAGAGGAGVDMPAWYRVTKA
jgi:hypothetical protein